MSYYFDADHRLATGRPSAQDARDHYAVDNTTGTGNTSRWNSLNGPDIDVIYPDRSSADQKLLFYTSPPLDQDMEVTGHPVINVDLISTATDGEFFAYLEDVDAKARVTYVTEGELRAVHRKLSTEPRPYNQVTPYHSFKRADAMPLVPGQVTELVFGLQPTSYVFKSGHAIRVALAGADKDNLPCFPARYPPGTSSAAQRMLRTLIYPSCSISQLSSKAEKSAISAYGECAKEPDALARNSP